MPGAGDIKNTAKAAKQAGEALKDVGSALSFGKALLDGSNSKIGNGNAFLMFLLAFILDLLKLISVVTGVGDVIAGPVVLIIQLPIYSLWFWLLGVNYWTARAMASKIVTGILSFIPALEDIVPATIIDVGVAIAYIRMEEFAAKQETKEEGERPAGVKTQTRSGPVPEVRSPRRLPAVKAGTNPLPATAK